MKWRDKEQSVHSSIGCKRLSEPDRPEERPLCSKNDIRRERNRKRNKRFEGRKLGRVTAVLPTGESEHTIIYNVQYEYYEKKETTPMDRKWPWRRAQTNDLPGVPDIDGMIPDVLPTS